jgi:uncharacterized protein
MKIDYDPEKSKKNIRERDLSFDLVSDFEWETAFTYEDTRKSYPERRFVAMGFLNKRLHVVCFTTIGENYRIISFRKANKREVKKYEKEIKTADK